MKNWTDVYENYVNGNISDVKRFIVKQSKKKLAKLCAEASERTADLETDDLAVFSYILKISFRD